MKKTEIHLNPDKFLGQERNTTFFTIFSIIFLNSLFAQNTTTRIVPDTARTPLPRVNVIEKSTKNSVNADFDGKFTMKIVNSNSILNIS